MNINCTILAKVLQYQVQLKGVASLLNYRFSEVAKQLLKAIFREKLFWSVAVLNCEFYMRESLLWVIDHLLSVSICPLLHLLKFCCISLRGVTKTHTPKTQTSDPENSDPPKLYSFFTNKHGESVLFSTISAMYFSLALTVLRILVNS